MQVIRLTNWGPASEAHRQCAVCPQREDFAARSWSLPSHEAIGREFTPQSTGMGGYVPQVVGDLRHAAAPDLLSAVPRGC